MLSRSLRPLQVGSLALGCIIGFGCFVLPGDFLKMAGPGGAALGVALGGFAMVVIAQCYGLMVKTLPVAGGEFAYAYDAGGRYHAYICGWLLTLGYVSIVPLNASALAVLGKFLAPSVFEWGYLYTVAGFEVYVGELVLASAAIILCGYFQLAGAKSMGQLQFLMTVLLVGTVVIVGGGTAISEQAHLGNMLPLFPPDRGAIGAVLTIVAISPWLYVGFDTLPQASEEFNFSPSQGKALMGGAILAGGAMYVILILSTAVVMPWQELAAMNTTWATGTTVKAAMGAFGLAMVGIAATMAIGTGINGFFMASSRLLFGMGRAKVIPTWFSTIHKTHQTPYKSIIFVGVVSLIAPWMGRQVLLWIVDMCAVGTSVGYLYTCVAAFVVARRMKGQKGALTHAVYGAVGAALSGSFLVLLMVPGMPAFMDRPSWIALAAWVALGTIFFVVKLPSYKAMSKEELDYLVLGQGNGEGAAA